MKQLLPLLLLFILPGCLHLKYLTLYKSKEATTPIKYIKWMGSKKFEYFINAEMMNNDTSFHYTICFTESGKVMNVIRYESKYYETEKTTMDSERSMRFLITDTAGMHGPTYFGEYTQGFYGNTVLNIISNDPKPPKLIATISANETTLFHAIDSLAKLKRINIKKIDSVGVIGWFRYGF